MRQKCLEIRDLQISFETSAGLVRAVRGIDLDLYKGEALAIVGESGSGKSVTVKAIMGIASSNQKTEAGTILYTYEQDGQSVTKDLLKMSPAEMRSRIKGTKIAMVFQDPMTSLDPTMTIGMQLMEGMIRHLKLDKKAAKKRAIELLEMVGITDAAKRIKNYPHQLSGGMRQRVVIAIALSCDPEILICDEPTTALDVTIQAKILELIADIQKRLGIAIIYITHDLGVVAKVADHVAVMYAGRIVEKGTAEEVFLDPRHPYTWGLMESVPDITAEKTKRLYTIPGTPPNMIDLPGGDPFAVRNRYALKADFIEEPPMFPISGTHAAATWLLDPRTPQDVVERMNPSNGMRGGNRDE